MYIYTTIAALVAGYVLDLCIGDPHGMWHPICFVGNLISFFEKRLRRGRSERADLAGGVLLVILVTGISTAIPLEFCSFVIVSGSGWDSQWKCICVIRFWRRNR